nr:hypothetical protein [Tanacetum cinerariifolium]
MFDCDDYFSSESDYEIWPPSSLYDRFQPSGGYHDVPPSYTGTFMQPKPDLVFNTAHIAVETDHSAFNVQLSPPKPDQDLSYTTRPTHLSLRTGHSVQPVETSIPAATPTPASSKSTSSALTQSKPVFNTAVRPVSADVPKINVTRPRYAHPIVTNSKSPIKRHITHSPSPKTSNSPPKVTAVQAPVDTRVIDSGCSRNMTGNMSNLSDFEELNGGYVAFGGNPKGGKISGKGKIKTSKLDFDDVYFVKDLKFNLFSVSQMCGKKNSVLFTDTECLVLSPDFKLHDASQVLLRVPRENNMYNVNLKNIVHFRDLTCLFAKETIDESNLWHRRLHMDLFGPTFVKSLNKKSYCLVVTDNYSRFTWVFFLDTKDETSLILKTFITGLENQLSLKGIKREFSVPRTPQQNGIVERKNRTLIEAARTMLADTLLPILFWAEAVNTACYVQNRVLVTKPHNKTPYELLHGRTPSIGFMRPFGCPVTILNTLDPLGKFKGNVDEGFLIGYYNYDGNASFDGKEHDFDARKPESEVNVSPSSSAQSRKQDDKTKKEAKGKSRVESFTGYGDLSAEFEDCSDNSSNEVNAAGTIVPTVRQNSLNSTNTFSAAGPSNATASLTYGKSSFIDASQLPDDPDMPELEDITYSNDEDDVGADADFNNLEPSIIVSPILTTRIHKDHHMSQIIGDMSSTTQTRSMTRVVKDQGTQEVHQALKDPSWIEAMQEKLLQFKMQKVWVLVDLPHGKRAIAYASFMGFMVYQMDVKSAFLYGTIEEEVYVCQPLGFEDPDHPDKVYKVVKTLYGLHQAPRAWYETLASYLLENGFQKGKIDQTLFIKKQKEDIILVRIYVDDIIFGATNKDLCKSFEKLMKDKFQMSYMGELTFFLGLQVKQKKDGIFISQDKYIAEILRKFGLIEGKSASTPIDTEKPLLKDLYGEDVDIHTYRSMIGSLMYLTSSRPGIMFAVCACARFQVTPKASHFYAVKRIFRYLKGKPHFGLWYPKDSPFDLVAYSDSDYAVQKKTVVATLSTEAEYVAAASCCAQVLWIQNQLLDYGYIQYALTVNLNIYVSCIKQFWNIVAIKQVNDVTRLQALVDKKKVVITEAAIREVLHLDDAEGVDCLPNEEIFTELARMGYEKPSTKLTFYKAFFSSQWKFLIHTILQCMSAKRTSWNKFSSSMVSAVICLSTERVGKGFFGVETPLFKGMLVRQEIEEEGDAYEHVEDVTAGDDAHGDDTAAHAEVPTVTQEPSISSPTPPTPLPRPPQDLPSTSQVQQTLPQSPQIIWNDKVAQALEITKLKRRVKKLENKNKVRVLKLRRLQRVGTSQKVDTSDDTMMDDESNQGRMIAEMDKDDVVVLMDDKEEDKKVKEAKVVESAQVQGRQAESQAEIYKTDMDHANKVLSMQEDKTKPVEVQEVVDVVTTAKLITEVVTASSAIIPTVEPQVPAATLTVAPARVAATPKEPKPLKKKEQIEMDKEYAKKLHVELNKDIDWDVAIDHVKLKAKEDPSVKRYQAMKRKPQTEAQARKNMMMYLKNVVGFKLDYFKGMSYDHIRPIFEAKFNSNVDFLLKIKEHIEEEESRALQTINETPEEKAAKRRKLNGEVEDLKRHLEIVPDEDNDVYTEATPLARKVPVVDYKIIEINNKPYYKIIRADGTHQLYISFLTLVKNFDREDLEALWNLVKERFSTSKPKNFFDDFLLATLGAMFENPDAHA